MTAFSDWSHGDAGIDSDDTGLICENGIEIDLANLRNIGHQLCKLYQEQSDGLFVNGGNVTIRLENARDPGASNQPAGKVEVEWRKRQGLVAYDFDGGTSLTERDDGAERGIIGNADDQLARFRTQDHWKDGHAGDPRARLCGSCPT